MARAKTRVWLGGVLLASLVSGGALAAEQGGKGQQRRDAATAARCEQQGQDLQQFESEVRALAVAEGCTDASQCRSAPVGARACGGPRDYLVYCAEKTDEDALQRALAQLQRREEQYNQQCDIVSTCIFLQPPQVELVNGVCQEAQTAPGELPLP